MSIPIEISGKADEVFSSPVFSLSETTVYAGSAIPVSHIGMQGSGALLPLVEQQRNW